MITHAFIGNGNSTAAGVMPRSVAKRIPIRALNKHSFGPATVVTHAGFVRDSRRRAREGLQSTPMAGERRAGFGLF
jgi:hypothetical protein